MKDFSVPDNLPPNVFMMSVLVGFFVDIQCVNTILVAFSPAFEGIAMTILYSVTVILILFYSLKGKHKKVINVKSIFIPIYCVCLYGFTSLFIDQPRVSLSLFFVFTIAAFFLPLLTCIDVRITLRSVMFFSIFSLLRLNVIFAFAYDYNAAISMGVSYTYLVPVLATIVYSLYFFKYDKGIQRFISLFLIVCNLVFLVELFLFGSRGPLLAIACSLMLFYILRRRNIGFSLRVGRILLIVMTLLLVTSSFSLFAGWIGAFFDKIGINSFSIDKIVRMTESGDLLNGRDNLSELAINGFFDSPLLGHGLDLFGVTYSGSSYPHNFLLQVLYDGGLLFFMILILPSIARIIRIFELSRFNDITFFIFIFCASIPGALFSGDLWENSLLWLFFGYLLNRNFIYNNEI